MVASHLTQYEYQGKTPGAHAPIFWCGPLDPSDMGPKIV